MLNTSTAAAQVGAAPLRMTATYLGEPNENDHWGEECKGWTPLSFKVEMDLEPNDLRFWSADKKSWSGRGKATIDPPANIECTRDIAMSDAQRGVKRTFSSVWQGGSSVDAGASVGIDLEEGDVNGFYFHVGTSSGACTITRWDYEITGKVNEQKGRLGGVLALELHGPNDSESPMEPEPVFTRQDLQKGFTRSFKTPATSGDGYLDFCGSGFGPGVWEVTLSYTPNEKKAMVALSGCTDIVVGKAKNLTARGTPAGGKYKFTSNNPDLVQVMPFGAAATITALKPGAATVEVEYTAPDGATGKTSEVVNCVEVESINGGQPVIIGLYDAKGNKKKAGVEVPVVARPANTSKLIYRAADQLSLTAVPHGEGTILLTPTKPTKTTVQALTSCGERTGPALAVEIVPCAPEVVAELRDQEKMLRSRIQSAVREMTTITGDDEFDRAAREGPEHIKELAQKTIELLGKVAAKMTPGANQASSMAERMRNAANEVNDAARLAKGIDEIADVMTVGEIIDNAVSENTQTAVDKTREFLRDKALDKVSNDWWGLIKTANEAAEASAKLGQDLGTMKGAADRLAELEAQIAETAKELDRVWHVLHNLCKEVKTKQDGGPQPAPGPTAAPQSQKPAPKAEPTKVTAQGESKPSSTETPAEDKGGPPKEPPPEEKPSDPMSVALYAETEQQCKEWSPVAKADSQVFSRIGKNISAIADRSKQYEQDVLTPFAKQTEALQGIANDFVSASSLPETERNARFELLRARMKENPPSRFIEFATRMEKFEQQTAGCAPVLRNSFEVKIEEIRTKY